MTQFIVSQDPDKPRSGQSLQKESTPGTKVEFVNQSTTAETSITLTTGQTGSIRYQLSLYPPDLPTVSRAAENVIPQLSCVAWDYFDFFTDTNNDYNYEFGVGASLTSAQKNITMSPWYPYAPASETSINVIRVFKNNDTSTHTIYTSGFFKYIIFGEETVL